MTIRVYFMDAPDRTCMIDDGVSFGTRLGVPGNRGHWLKNRWEQGTLYLLRAPVFEESLESVLCSKPCAV